MTPLYEYSSTMKQTRLVTIWLDSEKIEDPLTLEPLDELVQRRIQEAKLQFRSESILAVFKISDSPLRRDTGV